MLILEMGPCVGTVLLLSRALLTGGQTQMITDQEAVSVSEFQGDKGWWQAILQGSLLWSRIAKFLYISEEVGNPDFM